MVKKITVLLPLVQGICECALLLRGFVLVAPVLAVCPLPRAATQPFLPTDYEREELPKMHIPEIVGEAEFEQKLAQARDKLVYRAYPPPTCETPGYMGGVCQRTD